MSLGGECRRCGEWPGEGCLECVNCGAAWPLCSTDCEERGKCDQCGRGLAPWGRDASAGVYCECDGSGSDRHLWPGELGRYDREQDEREAEE